MNGRHSGGPLPGQEPVPAFLAGDIILFASTGDAVSALSRWVMRSAREGPTYAVHTGQFLDAGRVLEMEVVARVETVDELLTRRYWHGPLRSLAPPPAWAQLERLLTRRWPRFGRANTGLWRPRAFEVWRCRTLTPAQRAALTREAQRYVNVRFGFVKCFAHLGDGLISKLARRDVFLFRHIDPADRRPVCSGITGAVYDTALHYRFGVDPECVDPDHIYDWVRAHPDEWTRVFRLPAEPRRAPRAVRQRAGRAPARP